MLNTTAIEGLKRFLQHAETLHPNNNPRRENGFAKEFQEIKDLTSRLKKDPSYPTKHGEKEVNRPKNRYKDILPYDYTRIILPENNGIDGSDYINGNYIKGPTNEVNYLTAQGPLPCTVDDFWRMIISHKIQVIVMACKEYELGKLKCKRYWPETMEETLEYGGCKITLVSREEMGDGFIIRTLSAKSSKEDFKVTQFHYTAWPDHDVPRSATPLIELTMSFRAFVGSDNKVPVLVHCSAGCGRTGTICALDYARALIQLGRTENFSVFEIVSNLRKQRIAMVQTKEQYELVYKAVRELVNDELKKQRISNPTSLYYVNVEIPKDTKEDNTYENVDFIRSIQRLHQEEKNASRKPAKEPPPSTNMAVVPVPKMDVVLADKSNSWASKKNDNGTNVCEEKTQQSSKGPLKENLVQSSTQSSKPLPNQKTTSSYENVLPLSVTSKPPLAPRPQNYVNVVIGTSCEKGDDYVNIAPAKSVPVPNVKNEPAAKSTKHVPGPELGGNSRMSDPVKPAPFSMKPDLAKKLPSKKGSDYEIPPLSQKLSRQTSEPDYVISPILTKPNVTAARPQVKEGQLIDLGEPEIQPSKAYPPYKSKPVKQSSFDKEPIPNQESFNLHVSSSRPNETHKQVKTNRPSGQYSLVGALESPGSPDKVINNPFDEVPKELQNRGRNSLVEAVVSDGSLGKLEKPTVASRRLSEGSNVASTKNTQDKFFGTYNVVNEKTVPKEQENSLQSKPLVQPEDVRPYSESTHQRFHDKSPSNSSGPIQKAYSTENVNSRTSSKQSNLDSNFSDYSLASSPYLSKKSGSSTSALYSSAENDGPLKKKPPLALRRSNSGVLTTGSNATGDVEGLYATVGARSKKRTPLSTDTWAANGDLHSKEKDLTRSQNSTSSLRSVTSTSSNDSTEDIPPVPVKTMNAFILPGDEDAYEAVQRSSFKSSTIDRFRNKARNMINSGPQVPKISLGKRNVSPLNTPRSASPVLGERAAVSFPSCQLGYGNRVTKPSGPRSCPEHWPKF